MYKTTIKDALRGNVEISGKLYRLYLVREGNTVFYIGQSANPLTRLREHIGLQGRGMSSLGVLLKEFLPDSLMLTYELLTVSDCYPLIEQYQTGFIEDCRDYLPESIDTAELALIEHYHPCLNTMHNRQPSPLPEKYKHIQENEPLCLDWLFS